MQTFCPCEDFYDTARCLDRQRLGKQRVEAYQILLALKNPDYGWQNHPAVKMWRGYDYSLTEYGIAICYEWIRRGYKDSMLERFFDFVPECTATDFAKPFWLGNNKFHSIHRSVLLYKNPEWYSQFGWKEIADVPVDGKHNYFWPV